MPSSVSSVKDGVVTITLQVELDSSMMDTEEAIEDVLNETGRLLTEEALKNLDTDGTPISQSKRLWYSKGRSNKTYQTPYGSVVVPSHVYQRSCGGKVWRPMEQNARLIMNSTPKFARQISSKFSHCAPRIVQRDLLENHGRKVTVSFLQKLSDAVATIVQAKEEDWHYHVPKLEVPVKTIAISLDGTCMLMCESGWREAMAGSLSLYDAEGNRLHTIYLGATPEYGKCHFLKRLTREIELLQQKYPDANYIGIADGAQFNWDFLEKHTQVQILDFYHASGYLGAVAKALHPKDKLEQKQWLNESCHALKSEKNAADNLYQEMAGLAKNGKKISKERTEKLQKSVTYFKNHKHQMAYSDYQSQNYPIGSGVIEAACKTLIKQRLCQSGMRWKEKGAAAVLSLRALALTSNLWQQFWKKGNQYGFLIA